jgi:uncharacterized protein
MVITSKPFDAGEKTGFLVANQKDYLLYFPLERSVFRISELAESILSQENLGTEKRRLIDHLNQVLRSKTTTQIAPIPNIDLENNVLGLALTTACTLRCTYCHADAGSNIFISEQLIDDSIDYVFNFCKEHNQAFYLVFTGSGEPTANWKGLTRAVERASQLCKSANLDLHISMATNGVYGDEKRQYIAEKFSRVTISLDGSKSIHDVCRVKPDGTGSFEAAFATAKYFYTRNFPFRIRATVSKQASSRMLETYEFFKSEFPNITVAFEPLNPIGRGETSEQLPPSEEEFAQGYLAILDKYGTNGVSNSAIPSLSKLRTKFCTPVARPNMNVSVEGIIHSCARCGASGKFIFGKYDSENHSFIFDEDKAQTLSKISVEDFSECTECFARFHCAGDCHDLRAAGFSRCETTKMIVWKHLEQILNHGGTIYE